MLIDIVSDLHVDYWKTYPYDWSVSKKSDSVIIAGDISDHLSDVVRELKKACGIYKDVLYVEGNHESSYYMNDLYYANNYINKEMLSYSNFNNLSTTCFIKEDIAFIGACGWWDFNIYKPSVSIQEGIDCFNTSWNTLRSLSKREIVNNIINAAQRDAINIQEKISALKNKYKICLVLHTVPHKDLISKKYPVNENEKSHYGNSIIQSIIENEDSVKYVVFGHNHDSCLEKYMLSKLFINNARGRPKDYNRRNYYPLQINIS
jgi:predicted phosphodiesterase